MIATKIIAPVTFVYSNTFTDKLGKEVTSYKIVLKNDAAYKATDKLMQLSITPELVERLDLTNPEKFFPYANALACELIGNLNLRDGFMSVQVTDIKPISEPKQKPVDKKE